MNLRRSTAAAALAIGAMTISLGTAHAQPAPEPAPAGIDYSVKLVDKTVVTTLKGGTFELVEGELVDGKVEPVVVDPAAPEAVEAEAAEAASFFANIKDEAGETVMVLPLSYGVTGADIPVNPVVKEDGKVLELTPERPAGVAEGQQINAVVAKDIASPIENQRAMNQFSSHFGVATAIGGFVGTAIGFVVGGIAGCIIGVIVGCLPGFTVGAGIGGILGSIVVGGPTLVAAGMELLNTLQAEPGTTKWTDENMKPKEK